MKQTKKLIGIALSLALIFSSSWLYAQQSSPEISEEYSVQISAEVDQLFKDLATANLREKSEIIKQLDQQSGREMLPVYQTMVGGDLYYHKETLQLYRVNDNDQGEETVYSVFSGELVEGQSSKGLKKVRVNNKLRKQLRGSIARIQLLFGEKAERKAAVETMLSGISPETVTLFSEAAEKEQDQEVLDLLRIGEAMNTVTTSTDSEERVAAVSTLSGRLETPVRNLLSTLVAQDSEGVFRESDAAVRAEAESALQAIDEKISFYGLMEKLFFGLSLGSVFLLAAIGLAITFGVMGVINMAHGEMIMLGAYTTYVVQLLMPNHLEWTILVAIPAAFLVSGSVGVVIERTVIRFLHGRPLETLLATFGISLILQQLVRTIFSPLNRQVSTPEWLSGSIELNPIFSLTYNRLSILIFSLIVFGVLMLIMKKTSLGLNVRAVSQNRNMAKAMGIKTERVDSMTFGLGSGIAGVAGVALSQLTNVGPNLGQSYIIDSFMVVVFGGVGNLLGTLVGSFSLGIANKFLEPETGAVLANIIILVFIILFIQKRPKGLFPQKGRAAE
ncbi:urea ABC transporter permease subunit UrtB [Pseudomaricurvus sp.]|uniref:urea ABC transporter permease subunit UrtB n=1 Tax=Pseudomaricurvus sp. TaxID=2004510 RepID=UPI003F6AC29D